MSEPGAIMIFCRSIQLKSQGSIWLCSFETLNAEFQINIPCFVEEEKENGPPPHKRQKVDDDLVTLTEHRQSIGDDESRITPATSEKFDVSIFHEEVGHSSNI